jgi:hypothetical protein
VEDLDEVVERRVHDREPSGEGGEPLGRSGDSLGIAVDPDDRQVGSAGQQRLGVTTPADRPVEHGSGRHGGEHGDDLVDHHWSVPERDVGGLGVGHQRTCRPHS